MCTAHFQFFGRLNDFLLKEQRSQIVKIRFRGRQSIKHLAESLGVPHPEIGRVRINGETGDLNTIAQDGDSVSVSPIQNSCPIEPRFIIDAHLGRLAAYLRVLGFDSLYRSDYDDREIAGILEQDERILLSRDRRLLMRKVVVHGYCPRTLVSREQLFEVVQRFDLGNRIAPFRRCPRCNHPLESTSKEAVLDQLEPLTKKYFDEFHICPACGQIYWKGSHYERMQALLEQIQA